MMNEKYKTKKDLIEKKQFLRVERKMKFHQDLINYYDEIKYLRQNGDVYFEEKSSNKNAKSIGMNERNF